MSSILDSPVIGPCEPWITGADVDCDGSGPGSNTDYDNVAQIASDILFELSGREYTGICERTVRPCQTRPGCSVQILSRGHIVGWDGWRWAGSTPCGCGHLSQVKLAGYPVRQILEVKIDGDIIDPAGYRLDGWRYLVRLVDEDGNSQHWPACQALDKDDTETGTWSVAYLHGIDPPLAGVEAAKQLACELYKATNPSAGECKLPATVTRVVRRGISQEHAQAIGTALKDGKGLPLVASFLAGYNPQRSRRRSAVWSPDVPGFPRRVGS